MRTLLFTKHVEYLSSVLLITLMWLRPDSSHYKEPDNSGNGNLHLKGRLDPSLGSTVLCWGTLPSAAYAHQQQFDDGIILSPWYKGSLALLWLHYLYLTPSGVLLLLLRQLLGFLFLHWFSYLRVWSFRKEKGYVMCNNIAKVNTRCFCN